VKLLPFAGDKVVASGKVYERGGSKALVIEKIEAQAAKKWRAGVFWPASLSRNSELPSTHGMNHSWLAAQCNPNLKFAQFYGKPTAPTIA